MSGKRYEQYEHIPEALKYVLTRVNYEGGKFLICSIVQLSRIEKDTIDKWLVEIKHPLASQPGTQEFRIE